MDRRSLKEVSRKMVQILLAQRVKTAYKDNFREKVPSHPIRKQILSHVWFSEVYTALSKFSININHYQKI